MTKALKIHPLFKSTNELLAEISPGMLTQEMFEKCGCIKSMPPDFDHPNGWFVADAQCAKCKGNGWRGKVVPRIIGEYDIPPGMLRALAKEGLVSGVEIGYLNPVAFNNSHGNALVAIASEEKYWRKIIRQRLAPFYEGYTPDPTFRPDEGCCTVYNDF